MTLCFSTGFQVSSFDEMIRQATFRATAVNLNHEKNIPLIAADLTRALKIHCYNNKTNKCSIHLYHLFLFLGQRAMAGELAAKQASAAEFLP